VKRTTVSERALVLAPRGRDAMLAAGMLQESGIEAAPCGSLPDLVRRLDEGAGFVLVTEEALATTDLQALSKWIEDQEEWSDLPFILLTSRGGGIERNPSARRYLDVLGNVNFIERPFHPTTLVSIASAALRGRRRQYEARARLEALHESERQFRSLADSIPNLCWMAEADGHIFWYNQKWYDFTGTTPADMEGWGWQSVHDPDVLPSVIERWGESLATGRSFEMIFPLRAASGDFRVFLTRVQPVRDQLGTIVRWFGTNTDITDQQRAEAELQALNTELAERVDNAVAEREAAMAQLHEAQKLETLGQLTGGVAHDFNNLLTPITGALDLLNRRYAGDDARMARLLGNALQSAERAKTLVQRLLGFARRQSLRTHSVDLPELIENMRDLITSSIGGQIEVRVASARDLPPALVDPNQLELAVLNLCVNARDAMPNGGTLTIAVAQEVVGPQAPPQLPPGAYVRLSVIDTGQGMDEATLARAVEPFFSTKAVGRGTGLGLSMVHGLAAQLGGAFLMTSQVGQGTRADLYLPVAEAAARAARPGCTSTIPVPMRPLSILLVDDEPLVRTGTAEMLRDLGHHVLEAEGGAEALTLFRGTADLDVVVTDYMMPHMDGAELGRQLQLMRPDLPVLVVTGYAGGVQNLRLPQLAKPFRQADLAAAIQALLEPADDNVVPISRGR
jgi:PAS domain S-box-containing protein